MSKTHTLYYTTFGERMEVLHRYPDRSTGGVFGIHSKAVSAELRLLASGLDGTVQMVYIPPHEWDNLLSTIVRGA